MKGRKTMVEFLLTNGAKINATTTDNQAQAFHFACLRGNLDMVELLVQHRSHIHAKLDYGKDANPPVHANDDDSITPLMLACSRCHYEVTKYLIEKHRADFMHKSKTFQYTALDYAKRGMRGSKEMAAEEMRLVVKDKKQLVEYLEECERDLQKKEAKEVDTDFDFLQDDEN